MADPFVAEIRIFPFNFGRAGMADPRVDSAVARADGGGRRRTVEDADCEAIFT